jgi:nucleoside-diphosphate-sugar epimerase
MIIAVTGSKGFVGRNLVKQLIHLKHHVIEIDIASGIDITDPEQCRSIPFFDIMIHLAGKIFVPESFNSPAEFYRVNLTGTLNMLDLCRKYNARFVFSSSYIYGNPKYLPIDENHPVQAFNPYADSKILAEHLCFSYNNFFKVKSVIVRPFNLYGKDQHDDLLISSIIKQAKTGNIYLKSSKPRRDFIYIEDAISAFIKILDFYPTSVELFNIGSGQSHSVLETVTLINNLYDNTLNISFSEEERNNEVLDTVANIEKARKLLDWEPLVSFEEGLRKCINE